LVFKGSASTILRRSLVLFCASGRLCCPINFPRLEMLSSGDWCKSAHPDPSYSAPTESPQC
jgi:hypothetical protein